MPVPGSKMEVWTSTDPSGLSVTAAWDSPPAGGRSPIAMPRPMLAALGVRYPAAATAASRVSLARMLLVARPYGGFSPCFDEILQPKVYRVYAQLPGNTVDMGLDSEDGLRLARGAHEAARDGIGIHLHALDVHMGYLIGPTGLCSPAQVDGGDGLEAAIGTAVEHHPAPDAPPWYRRVSPRF